MAIDTAAKRRAISGLLAGLTIVGVTMDATPDIAWRQNAGWGYSGIEAATVAATPIDVCAHLAIACVYPDTESIACAVSAAESVACVYPDTPSIALRC